MQLCSFFSHAWRCIFSLISLLLWIKTENSEASKLLPFQKKQNKKKTEVNQWQNEKWNLLCTSGIQPGLGGGVWLFSNIIHLSSMDFSKEFGIFPSLSLKSQVLNVPTVSNMNREWEKVSCLTTHWVICFWLSSACNVSKHSQLWAWPWKIDWYQSWTPTPP